VANLIKVDADKMEFTSALQVCAEGRLYYVVVEDNKVGSDLLKNGNLRRKCTIIPLKQILVPNVDDRRIAKAKSLAPGRIEHALTLVGFPDEVEAAMRFVFGSTLICRGSYTFNLSQSLTHFCRRRSSKSCGIQSGCKSSLHYIGWRCL